MELLFGGKRSEILWKSFYMWGFFYFFTPRYNPFAYKTTFYNAVMGGYIAIQCKYFVSASHKFASGKI